MRVVDRLGVESEVEKHPTTGERRTGLCLPDWKKAVDLAENAGVHLPGLRLQNWDVAFCKCGPVVVESHKESELGVPQAVMGKGLFDTDLRYVLEESGTDDARRYPTHFPSPLSHPGRGDEGRRGSRLITRRQ